MAVIEPISQRIATTAKTQGGTLAWPVKFYLLAVIIPAGFFLGPVLLTSVRVVLMVMAVPVFISIVTGRMGRLNFVDLAICLFIVWMSISMLVKTPGVMIESVGSQGIEMAGGYFLARVYIQTREQFILLCKWLMVVGALLVPLAIIESVQRLPLAIQFFQKIPVLYSEAIVYNEDRLGLRRAQVVFAHPIHYGVFSSICFILCFVSLKGAISTTTRWLLSITIFIGVFLSLSSGALLAVIIQLILFSWSVIFHKIKAKWTILVILVTISIIGVSIISGDSPIRVFMRYASFSTHNAFWRGIIFEYGILNVGQNPIFGLAGNAPNWIRPHFMPSSSIDNQWLAVAVSYGIPGFFFLALAFFGGMTAIGLRNFDHDNDLRQLRYGWMFCFVGLGFTLATVSVWKSIFSFIFFMLGAAIWMLYVKPNQKGPLIDTEDAPISENRYTRFPVTNAKP